MMTPSRCRTWLEKLAGESATPQRTAAAFAFGVFLSFSPLLGLQIALGLAAAFVLRLSRAAVLIGLCTNLPAFMVPWYVLTTAAGAALLGAPMGPQLATALRELVELPVYRAEFWHRAGDVLGPLVGAFVVGTTAGALLVGALAYLTALKLLIRLRSSAANSAPAIE